MTAMTNVSKKHFCSSYRSAVHAADLFIYINHMNHQQVTIPTADPALQEMLIALLSTIGYEGFEQEDAALQAFIPETQFDAAALDELLRGQAYSTLRVEERNWNEEWEKNFQPVQ